MGVSMPFSRQKDPPMSMSVSCRVSLFVIDPAAVLEEVRDAAAGLALRVVAAPVVFERRRGLGFAFAVGVLVASGVMVASSPIVACRISSKKVHSPSLMSLAICLPVRRIMSLG